MVCAVRNKKRFSSSEYYDHERLQVVEVDFLKDLPNSKGIEDIDAAYYLIHSMSDPGSDFAQLEAEAAETFLEFVGPTNIRQIIYLSGITNDEKLSKHLSSRNRVAEILSHSNIPCTTLKAGIIVGSGSSSFEIIRDLVEKLPLMITPKWLNTRTQPIAIRNVIQFLMGVLGKQKYFGAAYDIGGPNVLSYRQMLLQFADVRGLKRYIYTLPVMTPRLSSYWLYFVTSTSYKLAVNLVNSMKVEVIAMPNHLSDELGIDLLSYQEAVSLAFQRIDQDNVLSSWKDALISSDADSNLMQRVNIPTHGCYSDLKTRTIRGDVEQVTDNIWSIGGKRGWYYGNFLWKIRGIMDKMVGGVGLRRGRTNYATIRTGDTLDFWRVLAANREERRLLLYAEMKLPGEAWLEFDIREKDGSYTLYQTATFRPRGLWGRIYWYLVQPFHYFIFNGMIDNIISFTPLEKD